MKYIKRALRPFLNHKLTLPSDTLSLPTITIIGDKRVLIEQHYKLLSFSDKEIILESQTGMIHINGENLVIKLLYPREIILEGIIKEVSLDT